MSIAWKDTVELVDFDYPMLAAIRVGRLMDKINELVNMFPVMICEADPTKPCPIPHPPGWGAAMVGKSGRICAATPELAETVASVTTDMLMLRHYMSVLISDGSN